MNAPRPWNDGRSPLELAGLGPASSVSAADAAGDEETADNAEQPGKAAEQDTDVAGDPFDAGDWYAQQDAQASAPADAADADYAPAFGAAEDDADEEEQHPASIAFWNRVEPITERVILNYQERRVTFRILDFEQEEQLLDIIQPAPAHRRTLAEARTRLYFALVAIDGRKTLPLGPAREAWIKRIPGPFVDALLQAYHRAAQRPVEELNKVTSDPFTDAARLQSGAF